MDKSAIKTFAINSRTKLMQDVRDEMYNLGITENNIADSITNTKGIQTFQISASETHSIYDEDIKKRDSLVREVKAKGFDNVVEEVAYTWFNRIIAIRFMEVNNYLPTKTRVLSSETPNKIEPDIITEALDLDLDYTEEDIEYILKLKDENKEDKLFKFLFIKQCNKLNDILPGLFEKTEDYMELLLNISYITADGVIKQLIEEISEDKYDNVEIIGWLYQFYNAELKDTLNNAIKSIPVKKEDIPAVTQLFTPDWIVKYMVDNSLGRYWIERNPNSSLEEKLNYYFKEPTQNKEVTKVCNKLREDTIIPEEIKLFDPCMGSGHILVYAFDVLIEIYKELGYYERDIPELILKNNLYGLDIDDRAYQLAYFALMMKARSYDRSFFKKNILLNIHSIKDSELNEDSLNYITDFDFNLGKDITYLNNIFNNAKEYGSLIQVNSLDWENIEFNLNKLLNNNKDLLNTIIIDNIKHNVFDLINQAKLLSLKYESVVTNPPYFNKYSNLMKKFVKNNFKDYSKDLFSIFIYRNFKFCKDGGFTAFMTPLVWMYLKSFEKLRKYILNNKCFVSLIEMEYNALWEIEAHVPGCTFILNNHDFDKKGYNGVYLKLSEFTGGLAVQNQKTLEALNEDVNYKFIKSNDEFNKIPGSPITYWVEDVLINSFSKYNSIENISTLKSGRSASGLNDKLFKYWYEVSFLDITFNAFSQNQVVTSFVPLNKGGAFRRWYGNREYVSHKEFISNDLDFKQSITWSDVSSSYFSARFHEQGIISNNVGKRAYFDDENMFFYVLGFLNTNLSQYLLDMIIPTLHFDIGYVGKLPIILDNVGRVVELVKNNIHISKKDWDSFETSWDFKKHPFLYYEDNLCSSFKRWDSFKINQFELLKINEIKLNNLFNNMYSVENIISSEVKDKYVSISKADYEKDVKSFISYAVGCMFGRYSLDEEGLQFAGGEFNLDKYHKFKPDGDNIIPVLDTAYFPDDIVGYFVEFVKTCFGEETLDENLDFIAKALSNKNKTSREIIREYLIKNFFKDHLRTYKKTPIYWMFNSGKQNGFNCLVYMHRYTPDLVARIRTEYLHKTQKAIEQNIVKCDNIINNSTSATEKKNATKEKNKLEKQLQETREYDEALAHIANQNISIDLDDGVKVNYAKFQGVEVSKEGQKTKKVNLLKKI